MKEEMVDTTYGDVIIKFPYLPLEFLHYYAMIIYQYSTGGFAFLEVILAHSSVSEIISAISRIYRLTEKTEKQKRWGVAPSS